VPGPRVYLPTLVLLGLSIMPACFSDGTKVSVLYTGEPYPGVTPYVFMLPEPLLDVTPVVASQDYLNFVFSLEEIKRAVRLYMPRNYASLESSYDVVILSDSNVASFTPDHHRWFREGVEVGGLGLVMVGGHETFGTHGSHADWGSTPTGEVLPVETLFGKIGTGKVSILDTGNEFMESLPWSPDLWFLRVYTSNIVRAKEGSKTLAIDAIFSGDYQGWDNPFFSTWDPGEGRTFAFTGDWQYGWGVEFIKWDYAPDFVINLMLYLAQRRIPDDLELMHTLRSRLATLSYRRDMLESLMAFVERFGANPKMMEGATGRVDEARGLASQLYLAEEFEEALEAVDQALALMGEAEDVADKARNSALFWIYLTEWLTVTGTSLLCGVVLWTTMIRRRYYHDVGMTRFR
jgi:uncharacterized membrane protein